MKKRTVSCLAILLVLLMVVPLASGCSAADDAADTAAVSAKINSVADLEGRRVATIRGFEPIENLIQQSIPGCELVLYDSVQELSEQLSGGNIDAFISEESVTVVQNYPDLCVIAELGESNCASAFPKTAEGEKLCGEFNDFLAELNEDGSLEEIQKFWVEGGETDGRMDLDSLTGENGIVSLGVCTGVGTPFAYVEDGEYLGYEIELAYRFCKQYGYKLTVTDYDFTSLLEAVQTGEIQMAASCITANEQRKKSMLFSDTTYSSCFQLVVRAADTDIASVEYLTTAGDDLATRFAGKTVAAKTGTVHSETIALMLPESEITFYNTVDDIAEALQNGEIDGYVDDEPVVRMHIGKYEGQYIAGSLEDCNYAYAFPKDGEKSELLISQMNEFLAELRRSGDLAKIDAIWFGDDEALKTVDYDCLTGENGTLDFAISSETVGVFAYEKDGKYVGYDVDIAVRFCERYGYGINIVDSNFSVMLASVAGGRCDFAGSVITVTEDRKEHMAFSDPNYYGSVVLVSRERSDSDTPIVSESSLLDALDGSRLGFLTGATGDQLAEIYTPNATIFPYNTVSDLCMALDTGLIDGYYEDIPMVNVTKKYYPDQDIYAVVCLSNNGMVFPKGNLDNDMLRAQINQYLAEIKASGVFNEINDLWFGNDEEHKVVDYDSLTGENGVLTVATSSAVGEPFAYVKDGQMVGYDLDMICRFCKEYGYGMNVVDYDFGGMLAAVSTGMADVGAACITITEERKETMNFSDPNYYSGTAIVTKNGTFASQKEEKSSVKTVFSNIAESFRKTFILESRWKMFAEGIGITVSITLLVVLFGTALGFVVYLGYRKNRKTFNCTVDFINSTLSKMPTILILMILYYIVFVEVKMDGFWVSVIGFSILFGGAVTDMIKVAVQTVPLGQQEASLALGYTELETFYQVILPQSLGQILPVYKAEIVSLLKGTSIVGYIAVQDLTKVSDIIRSRTFEPFFALVASTIIYILIACLLIALVNQVQIGMDPKKRSEKQILKGVKTK